MDGVEVLLIAIGRHCKYIGSEEFEFPKY